MEEAQRLLLPLLRTIINPPFLVGSAGGKLARVFMNPLARSDVRLVVAGIWNLAMVPVIAHLLLAKDTMGSLTSTNECWQTGMPV